MTTRIFIIGAGVISHHHAAARARLTGSELFAADPSPAARERFLKAFPDARVFPGVDEMLARPVGEEDLVVVATPPRFHVTEAIRALESGRSVLVEKPLALDVPEAERMWTVAKERGLHIATCGNRFQSWDLTRKAGELLREGSLGDVYLVDWIHRSSCQRTGIEYQNGSWWFLNRRESGGGPLVDWGPYDFNVLLSLFEPEAVIVDQAICVHPEMPEPLPAGVVFDTETQVVAALTFVCAGGRRIRVRYERTSATHGEDTTCVGLYGSRAHLSWDWLPYVEAPVLIFRRTLGPDEKVETSSEPAAEGANWMHEPLLQFLSFLRGDPGAIGMFDERALDDLRVIQAIYTSAESGQPLKVDLRIPPKNNALRMEKTR